METKIFKTINKEENKFLLAKSNDLPANTIPVDEVVKMLTETCKSLKAAGFHARQIGINDNIFVMVDEDEIFSFVHPTNIQLLGGISYNTEKCFSEVDDKNKMMPYHVGRNNTIEFDTDEKKGIKFTGYRARICQHEIDHGNGILLSNHISSKFVGPITVTKTIGRNDPCPCNSGKKYKKCCLGH